MNYPVSQSYMKCIDSFIESGEIDSVTALQCISAEVTKAETNSRQSLETLFLIYCATLVFLMQAGFAMICSGCVRKKNVQNTILKNLLDVCGSSLAFYFVGYAFAFGGDPNKTSFIGNSNFLLMDTAADSTSNAILYAHWLFHFAFAATAATIVAGTLAERCQMNAYLLYSIMLTGFVYPVTVHNIWSRSGFLSILNPKPLFGNGMIDFAGSGVVHVTGGFTALIATKLLGPRKGRFYNDRGEKLRRPNLLAGHSKSLQMLGSFILWFGWFGFNAGSALKIGSNLNTIVIAKAVANTALAGGSSGVTALLVNLFVTERKTGEPVYKLAAAMNGCLTGLAAITGSCGIIEPWAAVMIGAVAGLLYLFTSNILEKVCIDDAVDAIPVHLAGGSWGVIATGLLASPRGLREMYGYSMNHVGWFYSWGRGSGDFTIMGCQIVGLLCILFWTFSVMTPFFLFLNYMGMLRSDSLEEIVGLDVSYHGYTPHTMDGEVRNEDLEEYYRKNKRYEKVMVSDEEIDMDNVDRFE
mmetsp:Transcript_11143/g.20858  ORF Transcript_11143/g.20858 Transcript_11143/m.20858 type:complete len:525 (+) Transcript_11143:228-1802(+)|eukprot:CAMPEP_0176478896 /NCGR_PEP_ID=MMETSP0200_2-20121128/1434_1 /TAXON_ID=947934 /ORGANISM="Chaetoceros sp., Strain GSL56" /LENGTH=524 /DNA_ID=CAMNT_0017874871 /DNA_START=219 /DNA_END=1793 /DNA_ORIENTATION=-